MTENNNLFFLKKKSVLGLRTPSATLNSRSFWALFGVQFPQIQLPNRSPFVTRIKVTLRIFITRTSRLYRSSQALRGRCAAKLYTSQVTAMGKRKYECREGRLCTHVKVKHFNISYKSKSLQGLMAIHVSRTCMKTTVKTCLESNQDNCWKNQVML